MERSRFRVNRDLLVYKAFYFFFLGGFGSLFPYLPVYFRQLGLSASHVGLLIGFRPIVQFASAPFWAIVADRYRKRKAILIMSALAWLVMTLSLAFVEPTDEICEMRTGNSTKSLLMNYTKVKTGFFKRSVKTFPSVIDRLTEDQIQVSPDLVVVPFHRAGLQLKLSKNIYSNATDLTALRMDFALARGEEHEQISNNSSNVISENSNNGLQLDRIKIINSNTSKLLSNRTSLLKSDRKKSVFSGWTHSENDLERIESKDTSSLSESKVSRSEARAASDFNNSSHLKMSSSLPRKLTNNKIKTNRIVSEHYLSRKRNDSIGIQIRTNKKASTEDVNNPSHATQPGDTSGGSIDGLKSGFTLQMNEITNIDTTNSTSVKGTTQSRHKTRSQSSVIEFSKPEFQINLKAQSQVGIAGEISDMSGSGANDDFEAASGDQNKLRWHSKETSKSLRVLITSHISSVIHKKTPNGSVNVSSSGLFHHTFTVASKEDAIASAEKASNINHLSKLIDGMSTNKTSTGASASKSLSRKIAAILIHKAGIKTIDRLHKESVENSNTNVIHHNVQHHHVLPDTNSLGSGSPEGSVNTHANHRDHLITPLLTDGDVDSGSASDSLKHDEEEDRYLSAMGETQATDNISNDEEYQEEMETSTPNENESPLSVVDSKNSNGPVDSKNSNGPQKSRNRVEIFMKNLSKSNSMELNRIFIVLLVLIVFGEFLESPCFTLADASLLEMLGEERRFYGKQRLWGSIGFGLFSFIVGVLLERSQHVICGDRYTDYMICFCFFGVLLLFTLLVSAGFDFQYNDIKPKGSSVLSALCNVHYGSCLFAACILGVDYGMCHNFLTWYLEDLGASKTLMGIAIISRCFSDTLTFYFAGSIIKTFGQIRIMIAVLFSYAVIFTSYTLLANPWWIIPVEILDGMTYALAWSACTSYLAGASSPESVTTIQGILQGVYWGLGTGSGAIVGGYLFHHVGPIATFRLTAGCSLVVCALFCFAQWKWTRESIPVEFPQTKYTYLPAVEAKDTEALLSGYDTYTPRTKRSYGRPPGSRGNFNSDF